MANDILMGKELITMLRLYKKRTEEDAKLLAYATSDSKTITPNTETEKTKDGPVVTSDDTPEVTYSKTVYMEAGNAGVDEFIEGAKNGELVELWDINLSNEVIEEGVSTGKFKGTYNQGKITSVSVDAPADGKVEVSFEYAVEGVGQDGPCTVDIEDINKLYDFVDTLRQEEP